MSVGFQYCLPFYYVSASARLDSGVVIIFFSKSTFLSTNFVMTATRTTEILWHPPTIGICFLHLTEGSSLFAGLLIDTLFVHVDSI